MYAALLRGAACSDETAARERTERAQHRDKIAITGSGAGNVRASGGEQSDD
jgi:hypothetical protein